VITSLRMPGDIRRDRAILDLLHLQELGHVPGLVATKELQLLWGCSQSQVSRRLAGIDQLPGWRAVTRHGGAWVGPTVTAARPLPPSSRERWEQLRERYRMRIA
jgi:hypothetical protein